MKVFIELNHKDIMNAKRESLIAITGALQEIAAETAVPEPAQASELLAAPLSTELAEGIPTAPAPAEAKDPQPDPAVHEAPAAEPPAAAVTEPALEPAKEEKPVPMTKEDREIVQQRLKEIAKEGKTKGIKEIFIKRGVKKFSDLQDSELEAVLEEAEAL